MFRTELAGAMLAVSFCLSGVVRADDQSDARAIVAKAIKATGGEEKMAKFNAQMWKETGTYYGMGDGLPYVGNYAAQWPKQFKMEIVGVFKIVVNGDTGWVQSGGETKEMTAEELKPYRESLHVGWVATLIPLKDKQFKLSTLGETKVKDRPALGVRVSSDGHRDVNLYFDKEHSLLIKTESRAIASEQGGKEVNEETYLSEFKDVEGVKIPHKMLMTRDGEKYVESETNEIQAAGKLDDSVFSKP
jgi:hypothetical protein